MSDSSGQPPESAIVLYRTEDGRSRIRVRLDGETVWLTQMGLAELYGTTKQNVSLHVRNILEDGELRREATVKDYLTVQTEGERRVSRSVEHFSLDMILAVGFRVRSPRGVQFRRWATEHLREYLVKGFVLDDERLKGRDGFADHSDELLARIRDGATRNRCPGARPDLRDARNALPPPTLSTGPLCDRKGSAIVARVERGRG